MDEDITLLTHELRGLDEDIPTGLLASLCVCVSLCTHTHLPLQGTLSPKAEQGPEVKSYPNKDLETDSRTLTVSNFLDHFSGAACTHTHTEVAPISQLNINIDLCQESQRERYPLLVLAH